MRLIFVAASCLPFHAHSLEERPLGGTETAVIRLSEALSKRGHDVKVFTAEEAAPDSTPSYLHLNKLVDEKETDVLISVRSWAALFAPLQARLRLLWTGDSYDQFSTFGIGDPRVTRKINFVLGVSAWHASTLSAHSGFPLEKTWVLRNGVHLPYFEGSEKRERKRLIYTSTPYRGLAMALKIFPRIREKHPTAELHVYSGYDVYRSKEEYSPDMQESWKLLKSELAALPGCFIHDNLRQKTLAREYMKASIFFYPNSFEETSCISAMEAQAAGCACVSSDSAALPETIAESGILVKGRPGSREYEDAFVAACDKILSDDDLFEKFSSSGKARSRNTLNWEMVAENFERFLLSW